MLLGRVFIIFFALGFGAFGAAYALMPAPMAAATGIALENGAAVIDLRATYGGTALGIALFYLWCLLSPAGIRAGLTATVYIVGVIALTRAAGIIAADGEHSLMIWLLLLEIVTILIAGFALIRLGNNPANEPA